MASFVLISPTLLWRLSNQEYEEDVAISNQNKDEDIAISNQENEETVPIKLVRDEDRKENMDFLWKQLFNISKNTCLIF
uniref:Uncharacterized protein n=1 Tax=Acrobeloides nanus TaxID=290746 RepID=A0A914DSH3_9BILA